MYRACKGIWALETLNVSTDVTMVTGVYMLGGVEGMDRTRPK